MSSPFPVAPDAIARMLATLLEAQGRGELAAMVRAARPTIDETGYDNWDGGTTYYALHLEVPVHEYAKVEPSLDEIEQLMATKVAGALRTTGSDVMREIVITPALVDWSGAPHSVSEVEAARVWGGPGLRLFLSHISDHKEAVAQLKRELRIYGVAAFVAHEDITPSLEWQTEIEIALASMHAMAALLTPGFHASKWTDQEVGFALGRGHLVIPVRAPDTPYGFLGKVQALRGDLAQPASLTSAIVDLLLRHNETRVAMREALVVGVEIADSFREAKAVTGKVEAVGGGFTPGQLDRLERAITANGQVAGSIGVPRRLQAVIAVGRATPH